jgi:hypothetical protein
MFELLFLLDFLGGEVLKSLGACHCAVSSPAPGTNNFKGLADIIMGIGIFIFPFPLHNQGTSIPFPNG